MDSLPEPLPELGLQGLPDLKPLSAPWSTFSIPRLEEKPQNPIISALERRRTLKPLPDAHLPDIVLNNGREKENNNDDWTDTWRGINDMKYNYKSHIVSWDTLRSTYRIPKSPSPFVSEQAPDVIAAARNPSRLLDLTRGTAPISISVAELHEALGLTLVGCASMLHDWNAAEEQFVVVTTSDGKASVLIDGMDDIISDSLISQFVDFGTLLRRLETLIAALRNTTREDNSATFAFAHCLSSALLWIRREIAHLLSGLQETLCDISVSFQEIQSVVTALASLCLRDIHLSPKSYQSLPRNSQRLLSHIYTFLDLQVEQQAPRLVRAILSYILTVTSRPYFSTLSRSVGLIDLEDMLADARRKMIKEHDSILDDHEDNDVEVDSELELENDLKEDFPGFISDEIRDAIVRARRSIRILSSPEFEGGQTIDLPEFRTLEWVWTDDEVSSRALGQNVRVSESNIPDANENVSEQIRSAPVQKYKTELAALALFDLEPGSLSHVTNTEIVNFINAFPIFPPCLAPTLSLLAEQVLSPVSEQANALGRAALQRFLTPGTALHLRAHLVLLRAYLLLAAPAFKSRLTAALFSDADADEDADEGAQENPMAITVRTRARNANWRAVRSKDQPDAPARKHTYRPWPVGLAFGLTKQAQWPPGGSDLSFYLRRVIMDSLEYVRESENMFDSDHHNDRLGDNEFWDDAESRIGFAIRDLPIGIGGDKWLDPTLIEALDFLYMQYKPPDPLRSLITIDILSKYQRVFAFLLRLLRVETAMRLVFRLTRPNAIGLIFADYPNTQNLVLHLRFSAQAFVSALSAYVADTAICGNIDAFIARVRYAEVVAVSGSDSHVGPFADVYALMQRHSRVLDAILAACLLRGAQRAVGDILRALLEVILEFSVLVGNAYRAAGNNDMHGTFDEERAVQRVEALYAKFSKTMNALVKALRKITERGSKPFANESSSYSRESLPPASGGMEALADLLLRIGNMNDEKK